MADRVALCIPTFKRPKMLARLLDAVAKLQTAADLSVIVADNDAQGHAGLDLCRQTQNYRWPLTAVIAEKRGIAQVRNVLIAEALKTQQKNNFRYYSRSYRHFLMADQSGPMTPAKGVHQQALVNLAGELMNQSSRFDGSE